MKISHHVTGAPVAYYDVLEPDAGPTKPTMLLVHGGAHTGACYLRTVDGRPGWAHDFVRHGHRVIVPDWPGRGRSGYVAETDICGELVCAALGKIIAAQPEPVIVMTHSISGQFGWKLLEMMPAKVAAIIGVAPGPPGNMQSEPIVVRETPGEVQLRFFESSPLLTINLNHPSVPQLPWAEQKLIGDGTQFPLELSEEYVASLNPVPSRLLLERSNYRGAALKIDDLTVLANKRILLVVGTSDPDHPITFERSMRDWLSDRGAHVELYALGDYGIAGNGHMMMLERNSTAISNFIEARLSDASAAI